MLKYLTIVPESSGGLGNTSPALPKKKEKKKQFSPRVMWCFTFHYEKEEDYAELLSISSNSSKIKKCIIGREKGKSGATPHLQGYIRYKKKDRHGEFNDIPSIHWEACLGNEKHNYDYCSKEEDVILLRGFPKPPVKVGYDCLRKWQKKIVDMFRDDEDPLFGRKVYWFWEERGGIGKSILCKHLIDYEGALVVGGKNRDILYGVAQWCWEHSEGPRLIVIDIPRTNDGGVSFQAIESIKNGFFYSPKYEGKMVRFDSPHVIIFANCEPDYDRLSSDRWVVEHLTVE